MFSSNQLFAIYSDFTVIKTEFNPSCIANFEMIAFVRVVELNFESNPAVVIGGQDVNINLIPGSQQFFQLY
jgi:hypothetical protein